MEKTIKIKSVLLAIIAASLIGLMACNSPKNATKNKTLGTSNLFLTDSTGSSCISLPPPADKSLFESEQYYAGESGMAFDSTFSLIPISANFPVQKTSTVKSKRIPLVELSRIGKHFKQQHIKSWHKTDDYTILNFALYYVDIDTIESQIYELEYIVNHDQGNPEIILYTATHDENAKNGIRLDAIKGIGTCYDGTKNQVQLHEDGSIANRCKGDDVSFILYKNIE